ncbi:hypothetical protein CHGG_07875 [Chaetomium globosum CBS 148.51]|uniref:Uncharacterized protein n=1 Tax=Chaetomium globosum (strain ATCC 6205 / CBS 148.51 / DSM 1962 / NBRC 6347 / NRRL 1970) TaxID=306901 RepID=Q2GVX9_CHAGB|nr:uncharacterized protein CHGG_07875 [Chaetomium globosum CBS 148.51]EAQ86622.1 hypothetical protein CHGG_07875 [Chaetomium globosum CBS 148.51]
MAWDSKAARPRQSSAASGTRSIAIHAKQQAKRATQPQSQHVADPFLQDFLSPSFDAASYLNATLPPLQTSSRTPGNQASSQGAVPLAELSIQTQATLSQLNAHTTRLTNTLTELTNDILRSGGRLAYEVELLRGETLGLSETLTETLEDDIAKFVPGGLRTLTLVRSRLDAVIKTFGEAMEFVFPPSEVFSQLVLPLRLGARRRRRQPLHRGKGAAGAARVEGRDCGLKDLAAVWKGTAEEKGRARFIESLAKMVEDRHRELLREVELAGRSRAGAKPQVEVGGGSGGGAAGVSGAGQAAEAKGYGAYGLISQLQKLRNGL